MRELCPQYNLPGGSTFAQTAGAKSLFYIQTSVVTCATGFLSLASHHAVNQQIFQQVDFGETPPEIKAEGTYSSALCDVTVHPLSEFSLAVLARERIVDSRLETSALYMENLRSPL